jgi:hypothetical protein
MISSSSGGSGWRKRWGLARGESGDAGGERERREKDGGIDGNLHLSFLVNLDGNELSPGKGEPESLANF